MDRRFCGVIIQYIGTVYTDVLYSNLLFSIIFMFLCISVLCSQSHLVTETYLTSLKCLSWISQYLPRASAGLHDTWRWMDF